jgi:hypothetical protein
LHSPGLILGLYGVDLANTTVHANEIAFPAKAVEIAGAGPEGGKMGVDDY